jgi:hypothetical protein
MRTPDRAKANPNLETRVQAIMLAASSKYVEIPSSKVTDILSRHDYDDRELDIRWMKNPEYSNAMVKLERKLALRHLPDIRDAENRQKREKAAEEERKRKRKLCERLTLQWASLFRKSDFAGFAELLEANVDTYFLKYQDKEIEQLIRILQSGGNTKAVKKQMDSIRLIIAFMQAELQKRNQLKERQNKIAG